MEAGVRTDRRTAKASRFSGARIPCQEEGELMRERKKKPCPIESARKKTKPVSTTRRR